MKKKNRVLQIVFLLSALVFISCTNNVDSGQDNSGDGPKTGDVKILLIGNSYLGYNDFPLMFKELCTTKNKQVYIGNGIVYGTDLDFHAQNGGTFAKIESQKWDYVILQDSGPNVGYPGEGTKIFPPYLASNSYNSLQTLINTIKMNSSSTKIIFMMTWAYEDGTTWIPGQTDTYEIMQKKIYDNTKAWAASLNMIVSPVGWAFNEVLKTNKQLHYLYAIDSNHSSPKGSYLMGCVFYKTIFNETPKNNTYYNILSKSEAENFQKIADELVW